MKTHFNNGKRILAKDWKEIDKMVEKLGLSIDEAINLREFDKEEADKADQFEIEQKEAKKKPKAKGITDEEIKELFENVVSIAFKDKQFQNKDFHKLVADKYSNRQTPSRLKKMKEFGLLEDLGGTPKTYQIAKEK